VLICFTCRLDSVGSLCCSIVSAFRFIKAPYSVYRNRHLYIFIRSKISTKSAVFELLCKNRKWWSGTVSVEKLRAPSSIHRYMDESDRTSGLDGTSTSLSLRRRTRFTEIGIFIFLSGPKFPRNRRFFTDSAKTGSAGAERFRVKSYVPPALSNGIWMGAIGLPVWTGNRRVCLFFHFVRTDFAHA